MGNSLLKRSKHHEILHLNLRQLRLITNNECRPSGRTQITRMHRTIIQACPTYARIPVPRGDPFRLADRPRTAHYKIKLFALDCVRVQRRKNRQQAVREIRRLGWQPSSCLGRLWLCCLRESTCLVPMVRCGLKRVASDRMSVGIILID